LDENPNSVLKVYNYGSVANFKLSLKCIDLSAV